MSSQNIHKNSRIIIKSNSNCSNNVKVNKITIDNNGYKAECETHDKINKDIIDNTVTYLQQNIDNKNQKQRNHPIQKTPNVQATNEITTIETNPNTQPNNIIYKNTEILSLKQNTNEDECETQRNLDSNGKLCSDNNANNNNPYIIALIQTKNDNSKHLNIITPITDTGNLISANKSDSNNNEILIENNIDSKLNDTCILCDKILSKVNLFHADGCTHCICGDCIHQYYKEKIENNLCHDFKCPIYSCQCYYDETFIQNFISHNLFNMALKTKETNNYNQANKIPNIIKQYHNDYVIDLNDNKDFYRYTKEKTNLCPNCKKEALYVGSSDHYVKCLNCLMKVCKYCLREFTEDHFELSNPFHCKIGFRNTYFDKEEENCCKGCICSYLRELFFVIAGFIMMFIGTYFYINSCVNFIFCQIEYKSKQKGKCLHCITKTILLVIKIIIYCICFPFILISLPYFSTFISIMNI